MTASPRDYAAIVLRKAILMWCDHGLKVNRAYTPRNMAETAGRVTGKTYTSSKMSLRKAAADIEAIYSKEGVTL